MTPSGATIFSRAAGRWSGPVTMLGGALWFLLWVHFLLTHGPSTSDNKETFLGLSYYDSTKLAVLALTLCVIGLVGLRARRPVGVTTWAGTLGHFIAVTSLLVMILGVALSVWSVPWGETVRHSTTLMDYGFFALMIASLVAFIGLILLGIGIVRTNVLPGWSAAPLIIAGLAAVPWIHHTIHGVLIGLSWMVVGYALWTSRTDTASESV